MLLTPPRLLPDEMWPAREPRVAHRFIQLSDGERVRVVETGSPDGAPVLFLHGWGASVYQFRHNLAAVGDSGFRALSFDLRGHGLSDKPLRGGAYSLDAMTAHVLRLLDALELDRIALAGQSMSGRIALELALTSPDRVERVALLDPIGLGRLRPARLARLASLPPLEPLLPLVMRRSTVGLALRFIYGEGMIVSDDDIEEYWAPARFPSFARAMARLLREFSWEPVAEERLAELNVPAMVFFGTLDRLIRTDREGPLLQPRDGYDVRWFEECGHVVSEERAEEVNAALVAFFSGVVPELAASAGTGARVAVAEPGGKKKRRRRKKRGAASSMPERADGDEGVEEDEQLPGRGA